MTTELKSVRICKQFTFDAAHRLMNHKGKCKFLHGHTYRVDVIFNCVGRTLDETGKFLDFAEAKEVITNCSSDFDHACFLNKRDPLFIFLSDQAYYSGEKARVIAMETDPTAEAIGALLFDRIRIHIASTFGYDIVSVIVHETETCIAEVVL